MVDPLKLVFNVSRFKPTLI